MSQTLLIVDSNVDNVISMQACLAWHLGIPDDQVTGCYTSTEALDYLNNNPAPLLITAYEMPTLDGLSLIEQAREVHPDIVTCLISTSVDLEQDEAVQTIAPNGLLNQPFEPQQLFDIVDQLASLIEPPAPIQA